MGKSLLTMFFETLGEFGVETRRQVFGTSSKKQKQKQARKGSVHYHIYVQDEKTGRIIRKKYFKEKW